MKMVKKKFMFYFQKEAFKREVTIQKLISFYNFEKLFMEFNLDKTNRFLTIQQQARNLAFANEIKKITKEYSGAILLKGLWYSKALYEDDETRFSKDVDLFIELNRFHEFDELMKKNGYIRLFENMQTSKKYYYIFDIYDNSKITLDKLNHYVYKKTGESWLDIEVHTYLFSPYRYPHLDNEYIFKRNIRVNLGNKMLVNVLHPNDDFIYACGHLCKHLINDIVGMEENHNYIWHGIDGKLIYDMACMIYKWRLDWNEIVVNAEKWDMLQDILICLRIVNNFTDLVPSNVMGAIISKVEKDNQRGKCKTLLRDLSLSNDTYLFDGKVIEFVNKNQKNIERTREIPFAHNICNNEILRTGNGALFCNWSYEQLSLQYRMDINKDAVIYFSIESAIYDLHSVTVFIELNQGLEVFTRNMRFKDEEKPEWLNGICAKRVGDNIFSLGVKWEKLKIDINKSRQIGFQIGIMFFNEEGEVTERDTLFGENFYHFYDMGLLKLAD